MMIVSVFKALEHARLRCWPTGSGDAEKAPMMQIWISHRESGISMQVADKRPWMQVALIRLFEYFFPIG
jgi:hypothetical protein